MKISNFILVLLIICAAVYSTDVSSCQTIGSSGDYTLVSDLKGTPSWDSSINGYSCIKIAASDVRLNCNGHTIQTENNSITYAITANGQSDLFIENCKITNHHVGIYAVGMSGTNIIRNEFSNTTISINLFDSNENRISKNHFENSPVFLLRGSENKIDTSEFTDSYLKLQNNKENKLISNIFTQTKPTFNSVIDFSSVSDSLIEANTLSSSASSTNTGINLMQSDRNAVVNNSISSFRLCFAVSQSNLLRLIGNTAQNCVSGFALLPGTKNSYVVDNTANNNSVHGFGFFSSPNDRYAVGNNLATNNQYGIFVSGSKNSNFEKNKLVNSSSSNFVVSDSNGVTLINNQLLDGGNGLWIKNSKNINVTGGTFENKFLEMRVEGLSSYQINSAFGKIKPIVLKLNDTLSSTEMYQLKSANLDLYLLPSDKFFFSKNFVNFEVLSGAPVLDELSLGWYPAEISENDSANGFEMYSHQGTWNSLNWTFINSTNEGTFITSNNVTLANARYGILQEDQIAPFINLISPLNGDEVSSPTTFSFVASDNFANKMNCSLFIDGTEEISYRSNRGRLETTNSLELSTGNHAWSVSCNDKFGNSRTSDEIKFKVS